MKLKLGPKIMLLNVFLIIITSGSLIIYSYYSAKKDLEVSLGKRLEAIAVTGALMINGDLHDKIQSPSDANTEVFIQLREILRQIKDANNLDTEVYTFRQEGETLKFIVMTNEKSYIGDTYTKKEEMIPALNEGKTSHTSIYKDSHGTWLSAYAPIYDSKRQISGIIDVDIRFETFQHELNKRVVRLIEVSVTILIITIVISMVFSSRLVRSLSYLKEVTEKISLGQMNRKIQVRSKDEVGDLAISLERMRESLKVAMSMIDEKDDDD